MKRAWEATVTALDLRASPGAGFFLFFYSLETKVWDFNAGR